MEFKDYAWDILGEVGNMAFGGAASSLSDFIKRKVSISLPNIQFLPWKEMISGQPHEEVLYSKIQFTKEFKGVNLLVLRKEEALRLATIASKEKLGIETIEWNSYSEGIVKEIFNIMVGNMTTELSKIFRREISIAPSEIGEGFPSELMNETKEPLIAIQFEIRVIEENFKVKVMNLIKKEQAELMIKILAEDYEIEGDQIWTN